MLCFTLGFDFFRRALHFNLVMLFVLHCHECFGRRIWGSFSKLFFLPSASIFHVCASLYAVVLELWLKNLFLCSSLCVVISHSHPPSEHTQIFIPHKSSHLMASITLICPVPMRWHTNFVYPSTSWFQMYLLIKSDWHNYTWIPRVAKCVHVKCSFFFLTLHKACLDERVWYGGMCGLMFCLKKKKKILKMWVD